MNKDKFWWFAEEKKVHKTVFSYVARLEEEQSDIQQMHLRNARLYSNDNVIGLGRNLKTRTELNRPVGRSTYNVIQQAVDTTTAMIGKNRPKATFLTDGADFSTQRRAEQLDKFVYGIFESAGLYEKAPELFKDGGVFGHGALKFFELDDKIKIERTLIEEIIVDQQECLSSCEPIQMHQRRFVHRETLKADYPEFEEEIEKAQTDDNEHYARFYRFDSNQVAVVESWRLPRGKNPGRHTICISNADLFDEEYNESDFPFVFFRWNRRLSGFYGQGIAERLTGIQLRINKLLRFIDRMQDLMSKPRIFLDISGGTVKLQLDDSQDVVVIPYRGGKPPTYYTPTAVAVEIYQYVNQLKTDAFEAEGISRMQAHMQKPIGIESAPALREWHDNGADRQSIQAIAYEKVFEESARKIVSLAKKIYGRKKKFTSVFQARSFIEEIDWSEVDMQEDMFRIKVEASSILNRTPAGREQSVIDWLQADLIDKDEGRRLLDHPDIERSSDLNNAAVEDIEATIELLLKGVYDPPEPFQHLAYGLKRVQQAYLRVRRQGAPPEILDNLSNWLEAATAILETAQKKVLDQQTQDMQAQQAAQQQAAEAAQAGMVPEEQIPPDVDENGNPVLTQ